MPPALGSARKRTRSEHKVPVPKVDSDDDEDRIVDATTRLKSRASLDMSPGMAPRRYSRAQQYDSPHCNTAKLKILLLGDGGTGKTGVTQRFIARNFDPIHKPTLSVDMSQIAINVGRIKVQLAFYNLVEATEGTQRVYHNHFQGVHGAFIVGDIAQPHTIAHMLQWKALIDETLFETESAPISVFFLANKIDKLEEDDVQFSKSTLDRLCKTYKVDRWFATSAKTGVNIDLVMKQMVLDILKGPYKMNFQSVTGTDIAEFEAHVVHLKSKDITPTLAEQDPLSQYQNSTESSSFRQSSFSRNRPNTPGSEKPGGAVVGCKCVIS